MKSKSFQSGLRSLAGLFPETAMKKTLRCRYYSLLHFNKASYRFVNGCYLSRIHGHELKTYSDPYGILSYCSDYFARTTIASGDVVIDAGCYNGLFALYAATLAGRNGTVIAIDADDANLSEARRNLSLNPAVGNVSLVPALLWDEVEPVSFHRDGTVASSAFWTPPGSSQTTLVGTTLDQLAIDFNLDRLAFIKMDIEGAEINALKGARQLLRHFKPCLAIASYHIVEGKPTYPQVEALLKEMGYAAETVFYPSGCVTYA